MSFSRKTLIFDCGATRLALGRFNHASGRCQLQRHWVSSWSAPAGGDDPWLEQTAAAFQALRAEVGRGGPCVLVLPGHLVLTKFFAVPRLDPKQRQQVLKFESEQNLPIALSELVWDSVVSGERSEGLEVMLAASHLKKVSELCRAARRAGFEPRRVLPDVLATLAAYRRLHGDPAESTAVINLGVRSTTFLFLEQGRFLSRTVLGGADAPPPEQVAAVVGQELVRTIRHHQRQSGLTEPARFYLAGDDARLLGAADALSAQLGRPVEIFTPAQVLGPTTPAGVRAEDVSLALIGGAEAHTQNEAVALNLLPQAEVRLGATQRRRAWVAAACLLASAAALAWTTVRPHRVPARTVVSAVPPTVVAVMPPDAPVVPVAVAVPATEDSVPGEIDPGFQLLAVRAEPYRLQLAGYLGGPDGERAILVGGNQSAPVVAGGGFRLDSLGVEVRSIELRQVPVTQADGWPVMEFAAFATVHDERTGEDVVLDSRAPRMEPVKAWLRGSQDAEATHGLREGDVLTEAGVAYRVDRIQRDPPEVILVKEVNGEAEWEGTVLRPLSEVRGRQTNRPRVIATAARD